MKLIYALLLCYTFANIALGNKEISYRDPNIQYVGRWHNTSRDIQSGWPGAYFKVTLQQTRYIKLQLSQPTSLLVTINKEEFQFINISTTTPLDLVPQGLVDDGPHELVVIATNVDPSQLSICLSYIILDDTASTVPPEAVNPLVEYVGHDLTLGIDSSRTLFTSFAWLTSKLLGLEHAQVAYRNATLVKGIENRYFDRTIQSNETPWSVVILLGANDDQTDYSSNEYRESLNRFLTRIRKTLYETAPIFILSEPLGDMFRPSQQSVIDMTHGGDQHIYFIDTTAWLRYGSNYYNDPKHLNDAGHELLAKKLAPLLQIKLSHPRDPLPGPPPNPNLPGEWQTIDVGQESRVGLPGTVSADSASTFTLWGSGADIDNDRDAFRFVYQPFSEQGIIEATVRSHSAFAKCAKAGIMIREHLGHGSPLIMLGISPAEGIFVQVRYGNFQTTKLIKKMRASPPYRLRLIRQKENDMFEAQIQHVDANIDGWETLVTIPFVLARDVYAGLAVTSCDTSVVSVAKFTEVGLYHSAFISTIRLIDQQ
ncbi:uncharacterized protein EV154DRAFT_447192 [Mucor mucedo]|uniref:uncharacterized protein n=1 Tax=Mucor mucedo TaxID=29922 RepID=UPI0022200990|nr:uncharacterized protein EV154DRAFT_447192 [Mucor mucedo]KAI7888854.1 hypothetical protein EV154DRAFT_447192 [Mucor mucedo]